jgi:putative transposase
MLRIVQLLRSSLLILITVVAQGIQFLRLALSSRAALSAEVLFLRKQLAFYQEHQIPPRKLTAAARFSLLWWSRFFNWREALMIVKPETLVGWHRQGFKLWWRSKSRLGRPRIPDDLRRLIVRMVRENPTWGEERVAAELSLKLGILVSPRTVRAYWPRNADPKDRRRTSSQHWRSFVRNHAQAMVAADFLVAITAGFRVLYVLVVMEIGSRRILHCNITAHPTAAWTLQQFREAVASDHAWTT